MTKPFSLINELENQDTEPAHLKRNKIVSLLKKKFDFENSHLKSSNGKEKGILAKCFGYLAPDQAKELGIYPYFKEIEEIDNAFEPSDAKAGDWNKVVVYAKGNRLWFTINGKIASEVIDNEKAKRLDKGYIGFQLHGGDKMVVAFKDISVKR